MYICIHIRVCVYIYIYVIDMCISLSLSIYIYRRCGNMWQHVGKCVPANNKYGPSVKHTCIDTKDTYM